MAFQKENSPLRSVVRDRPQGAFLEPRGLPSPTPSLRRGLLREQARSRLELGWNWPSNRRSELVAPIHHVQPAFSASQPEEQAGRGLGARSPADPGAGCTFAVGGQAGCGPCESPAPSRVPGAGDGGRPPLEEGCRGPGRSSRSGWVGGWVPSPIAHPPACRLLPSRSLGFPLGP